MLSQSIGAGVLIGRVKERLLPQTWSEFARYFAKKNPL